MLYLSLDFINNVFLCLLEQCNNCENLCYKSGFARLDTLEDLYGCYISHQPGGRGGGDSRKMRCIVEICIMLPIKLPRKC